MIPRSLTPPAWLPVAAVVGGLVVVGYAQTPRRSAANAVVSSPQPPTTTTTSAPPTQPKEIETTISASGGSTPHYAVPDFVALTNDAETQAIAKTIGEVLWADLAFEREFDMIPRDTYGTIPPATSIETIAFDRWRELGADGLVFGTVEKTPTGVLVKMRLFSVKDRRQALAKEYSGSTGNPRLYAHTIADEIHQNQRGLRGVARTKLVFSSDRDSESVVNTVEKRTVKELYIADYDGANVKRVTINRVLNIMPSWSPDGRAIAYTSYRRGFPDIYISNIFQASMENPTNGKNQNYLPAFSPDGTRIAFVSDRDGNSEIYVMNRDGSNVRRLTNNPAIDVTPTWSPTGAQIAFTSDRSGNPQIYIVGVDGLGLTRVTSESYCDRPTWSPAPLNEIAYASRTGPGYDIKIYDLATKEVRQLTEGQGSNESPSYSPNGRHIAFTSSRRGKYQVFTIDRDGRNVRQVTREGGNFTPDWSK
jgi:TolB protein